MHALVQDSDIRKDSKPRSGRLPNSFAHTKHNRHAERTADPEAGAIPRSFAHTRARPPTLTTHAAPNCRLKGPWAVAPPVARSKIARVPPPALASCACTITLYHCSGNQHQQRGAMVRAGEGKEGCPAPLQVKGDWAWGPRVRATHSRRLTRPAAPPPPPRLSRRPPPPHLASSCCPRPCFCPLCPLAVLRELQWDWEATHPRGRGHGEFVLDFA